MRKIALCLLIIFCLSILLTCKGANDIIKPPPYQYWDDCPAWSNEIGMIAYFSKGIKDSLQQPGIYITETGNDDKTLIYPLITPLITSPFWLQGDTEVVFSYNGIYKTNIGQINTTQLIDRDIDFETSFDISMDGQHIYFDIPHNDQLCQRLIIHKDLIQGNEDTITCGFNPSIAPDELHLSYCYNGVITIYDLINDSIINLNIEGSYPDWSPLGSMIVYQRHPLQQSEPDIYITDLMGNTHIIVEKGSKPRYSADGLKIIYVRFSGDGLRHIWSINIDGTNNQQLTF